jgi:molecular chaperone DnaK
MGQKIKALGIDLGTTNSVVACVKENGSIEVLPNAEGERLTPSVFSVWDNDEIIVGKLANDGESSNVESTIRSIKRHMGTEYRLNIKGVEYSPEKISAAILSKLKLDAEAHLGYKVDKAVITVPAYFDSDARQSTKIAGEIAGFEVLRVINEPTAAALAYGLEKKDKQTILVYDLGGGTFDITILKLSGDGMFNVQSTSGDTLLGGDDFDHAIMEYCRNEWGIAEFDEDFEKGIRTAAESAKKTLTSAQQAKIVMHGMPVITLTRDVFNEIIEPIVLKTKTCLENALRDAGINASQIDEVVFVGGSTRIPLVSSMVEKWTGKKPNKTVNPDEAVAVGAARQAAILSGQTAPDILLVDVIPLTLGIETASGVMDRMINRNTTIPTESSKMFTTTEDNQNSVAIKVYQGERLKADGNKLLGQFKLENIPEKPRGVPEVEVTFHVDANGILSVKAKELISKIAQRVVLTGSSSLTAEEVTKMMNEAELSRDEDESYFILAAAQDKIKGRIHQVEAIKRDAWNILSQEVKDEIEDVFTSLIDAQENKNVKMLDSLDESCQETMLKANKELADFAAKLIKSST